MTLLDEMARLRAIADAAGLSLASTWVTETYFQAKPASALQQADAETRAAIVEATRTGRSVVLAQQKPAPPRTITRGEVMAHAKAAVAATDAFEAEAPRPPKAAPAAPVAPKDPRVDSSAVREALGPQKDGCQVRRKTATGFNVCTKEAHTGRHTWRPRGDIRVVPAPGYIDSDSAIMPTGKPSDPERVIYKGDQVKVYKGTGSPWTVWRIEENEQGSDSRVEIYREGDDNRILSVEELRPAS